MPSLPIDRAVILAGGGGTRLWPWTGPDSPKPLLPLGGGGRTLLRAAVERMAGLVDPRRVTIQAPPELADRLAASRPGAAIDTEPSARDTAAAVALAMERGGERRPGDVVAILPADQRIADPGAFAEAMTRAARIARDGALVLLAVPPRGGVTRFGYIECGPHADGTAGADGMRVVRFVEKPDAARAEQFASSGRHFWNAGIFVWRVDAFRAAIARHAPEVASAVRRTVRGERDAWESAPRTSIDYALLERVDELFAVRLDAGWDDLGTWGAVLAILDECERDGVVERLAPAGAESAGSLVVAAGGRAAPPAVALPAGRPLLVVHAPGGTLVTPRDGVDGA